jgi:hypothetical protein
MSQVQMTRVLPEYYQEILPKAEPFLKRAVDVSRGRYDMPSLIKDLIDGTQKLWIIFKEENNEIVCAFTTMFVHYPLRINLSVTFIGSDDESISKEDWIGFMEELMDWGRIYGCSAVESVGRRAWGRIFKDIGFEETFTTVEGEISNG